MRSLLDAPIPDEPPALLAAVRGIQSFYKTKSPATHRDLAPMLAQSAVGSSKAVLDIFSDAQKQLQPVQAHISEIQKDINSLTDRLSGPRSGAGTVVWQTSQLRANLSNAQYRAAVSNAFLNRFVLQGAHAAALQTYNVDATYLEALRKLNRIDRDFHFLLRSGSQRARLEALEFAANKKKGSYEKVLRFFQAQCGILDVNAAENEQEAALLRESYSDALRSSDAALLLC